MKMVLLDGEREALASSASLGLVCETHDELSRSSMVMLACV